MSDRQHFDLAAYVRRVQGGPCFICEIGARNPEYSHHIIYEDDAALVFLNAYPTLYGYVLVAPRRHREQVTGDFTLDEYLQLQRVIFYAAEAVRQEISTERIYLLSLGSQQGNRHVHWHIAPLPPGVPYDQQQLAALSIENGYLKLSDEEALDLAARLRRRLNVVLRSSDLQSPITNL
jgi:ATP adenylyltransferase